MKPIEALHAPLSSRWVSLLRGLASCAVIGVQLHAASISYTLNWIDNSSDETGFRIERADGSGSFAPLANVGANVVTYTDTTAQTGVKYQYRVNSFNAVGNSFFSNAATNAPTVSTQPPPTIAAPSFSTANITVVALGIPAPTYQWRKNGVNLTNAGNISGVTLPTLTITGVSLADAGTYSVVLSNSIESGIVSNDSVLTVVQAAQTITFNALATKTFGDPSFDLTATASSGLAVSYASSDTNVATITGNTVTIVGGGSTVITANQAGDGNYLAAPIVQRTLTVNKANQTITFNALAAVPFGTAPFSVSATASSGLPVSFSSSNTAVATVSGTTVTIVGGGATNISANQPGNANYNAATPVPQSLTVNKINQTITFNALPAILVGDTLLLSGTSNAGIPVLYSSSQLSVATLSGSTLTAVGPGTSTITAGNAGNANYNAASVPQTLQVKQAPVFTIHPGSQTVGVGFSIILSSAANGTPAPTFQWQISTDSGSTWNNLSNGSPYSNVTTANLTIDPASASINGFRYRSVATNSVAATPSNAATITVNFAPSLTQQPSNSFAATGGNTTFTAVAAGNPAPTLQWQISTTAGGSTFTNLANDSTYAGVTTGTLSITAAGAGLNNFKYRVVATNTVGSTNSTAAVLTVGNVAPTITTNPANLSVSAGVNATFSAAASGGPAPTLQWQVSTDGGATFGNISDGAQYSGVTTGTLTVTAAPLSLTNARYRAVATNTAGSATTTAAVLTVNPIAPSFTLHPTNQASNIGGNASFTVAATGVPTPSLQWQVSTDAGVTYNNLTESAPYSGTTTTTLTITSATGPLHGNRYRAVATNSAGSANSNAATFTIGDVAPAITTNPSNQIVPFAGNASFTVAASGSPAPTFQWQVSTNGGVAWGNVSDGGVYSGATTTTLTITGVPLSLHSNQYRAVATNVAGNSASSGGILSVTVTAPAITTQPTNQNPNTGGNATFTVGASGSPAPTIQWLKDGVVLADGGVISGSATTTLTLTGVTSADAGTYTATASNAGGTATSNGATLIVNTLPAFTVHPATQSVPAQQATILSVTVTGTPSPTLQWQKNTIPIAGATSSTFIIPSTAPGDAGTYTVVATNIIGSVTSNGAVITVTAPLPVKPTITSQPASQNKKAGESVSFAVSATGSTPLTYQWRKDGVAISGATGSSFTLSNLVTGDAGTYTVSISNAGGSVTSAGATLAVAPLSYQGEYFGTFGNNQGSWALYVRADGTGLLIAFLSATKTSIVENVTVSANGTFNISVVLTDSDSGQTAAREGTPPVAAAATTLSVSIANGLVSGQLGNGLAMSGAIDPSSGTGGSFAGLYTVSAIGTSQGTTYTVIGGSGQALAVIVGGTSSDAVTGKVNASGQLAGNTATGSQFSLGVSAGGLTTTVTPPGGTPVVSMGISDSTTSATRLANMSARAIAGTGEQTFIIGFIAQGGTKPVLLRAVGPGLTSFGFTSPAADPQLSLYSGSTVTQSNDNWGGTTALKNTFTQVGAFGLADASKDAALATTLSAQAYTIVVGASGTTLAEIYDTDVSSSSRLINLSARAQVGTGDGVLIIGFIIPGNAPKTVLLRAVGPSLARYGILSLLADPQIELYQGNTLLARNDDWGGGAALTAAFDQTGAFSLNGATSKDAAMIVTLAPGVYTAVVSGVNSTTGVSLAEIYELR